ncbi:MAG: phosphatidylserine/phosphatidylglycerophosphate/cardiolipin synthase family protein [Bacteroidia bacterium]|nr:phosphatidylserine/phosphatidylglycerophosphate/cardiolipin synthase family protein [Bacteroidia bacterium]
MSALTITKELKSSKMYPIVLLHHGGGWNPFENGNTAIFETGPQEILLKKMIEMVDRAQNIVCFQSFLMQNGPFFSSLKNAAKRGVRIYALGAAEARLANQNEEEDFKKEDYINLLNETFKGHIIFRTADYFHAKYLLIDPNTTNAEGFLLTCNFTKKAFTVNPELGLLLDGRQVSELFEVFVYHFWEYSAHQHGKTEQFKAVIPSNRFNPKPWNHVRITSPNLAANSLLPSLMAAIRNSSESITVSAFGFERDHDLCKEILKKAEAGLQVTIFAPPRRPILDGFAKQIVQAGGKVISQSLLHAKFLVADQKVGYLFTANLESRGLDSGMEVGVLLSEDQVGELNNLIKRWKEDFQFLLRTNIQTVHMPNQEFSELGSDGKLIKKKIEPSAEIFEKRSLKHVSDLRRALKDFESRKPKENAITTIHLLELEAPPPPETQDREAIAPGLIRLSLKEKSGSKFGIHLTDAFQPESLNAVDPKWNNWPVFI